MPEGAESPPPERQSGKQLHEPPASGQGVQNVDSNAKKGEMEDQLKVGMFFFYIFFFMQ